jgi:hypothetical protein
MALALTAALALSDRPAAAQALSLDETRACLCKEQQIQLLRQDLQLREQARADAEAKLADFDLQLAQRYATVDTDSELSVEQYKYIWEQRWALQSSLQRDLRPAYNETAQRLNAVVADYNAACANRTIIKGLADQVRPTLQCPAP